MPDAWDAVCRTVDFLTARGVRPVTLLVVPGRAWHPRQIDALRGFSRDGLLLAGHGWSHAISRWGGLYHRLHGLTFSRNAAEHLALPRDEILALVRRCHAWFSAHGLPEPDLYVPPAWALGDIGQAALAALPFRYFEDLGGIREAASYRHHRLPLLGYQADAPWRGPVLRASNWLNWLGGRRSPVRIAIHPDDLRLPLAHQLEAALARCHSFVDHRAVSVKG
jgi:predicted deacetylase